MKIQEIIKVSNVLSRNLNVEESEIVLESIEDTLVFVVLNKNINYRDICYSVPKRTIDRSTLENIRKEVGDKALLMSHYAIDHIGLGFEPLYDNDIVEIAGDIFIKISGLDCGYSNMKDVLKSIDDLIELLDKNPSFKHNYNLTKLKDIRSLIQDKLISNIDILYDFGSSKDMSDKDRAAISEYYKLESMINTSLKKTVCRIITDGLDKDFIIVI